MKPLPRSRVVRSGGSVPESSASTGRSKNKPTPAEGSLDMLKNFITVAKFILGDGDESKSSGDSIMKSNLSEWVNIASLKMMSLSGDLIKSRDENKTLQGKLKECEEKLKQKDKEIETLKNEVERGQWEKFDRIGRLETLMKFVGSLDQSLDEVLAKHDQRLVHIKDEVDRAPKPGPAEVVSQKLKTLEGEVEKKMAELKTSQDSTQKELKRLQDFLATLAKDVDVEKAAPKEGQRPVKRVRFNLDCGTGNNTIEIPSTSSSCWSFPDDDAAVRPQSEDNASQANQKPAPRKNKIKTLRKVFW